RNLFTLAGLDRNDITGVIISSVVPPVNWTLGEMSRVYLGKKALFVEMGVKTGMAVLVDNPSEVGADRIVNGVAAFHLYGGPCIVVDFGTAITFDAISVKGEYLGGVIAPGLGIAAEALFARAAKLPRVEIKDPGKVIGTNTVTHMQAGLYYGAVDMVDGMLTRMKVELGGKVKVIATGGQAKLVAKGSRHIETTDELLTLEAVFKGIDSAFESYGRSRRGAGKPLKSLAYCTDAVLQAAEEAQEAAAGRSPANAASKPSPFGADELREYFRRNTELLQKAA